ncbi:hypothetical protein LBMAG56_04110 [Verrucomicrobiota bacterium]|nr:hypothetical protein LBMAG56_04110 [Verrucomicrobiota bacterium]
MKNLLSISDIVETIENQLGTCEVCATAEAVFEDATALLVVDCDSFLRVVNQRGADETLRPEWLPHKDSVKTHVPREEAVAAAKDIFRSWVKKVRQASHQQPSTPTNV